MSNKVFEIFGQTPVIHSVVPSTTIVGTRAVGIEIEVENAAELFVMDAPQYWAVKTDSSLRNEGAELVLRAPLAGLDLQRALQELAKIFHSCPRCHVSERTSVHVHVDCRDLSTKQVQCVLTTYVAAESALYMLGGKHRYDNIYCPGVSAALEQMSVMRYIMGKRSAFIRGVGSWCKYTGINLAPLANFGSIEFRAHEGTTDTRRVREWVNILLLMFDYACADNNSPAGIEHDARSLGYDGFLQKIFKHKAPVLLQDGVYRQYYKNNMINLADLLHNNEAYSPEKAKGASSSSAGAILQELEALLGQSVPQPTTADEPSF